MDGIFGVGMLIRTDLAQAEVHQRLVVIEDTRMLRQDLAEKSGAGTPRGDEEEPLGVRSVPVGGRHGLAQIEFVSKLFTTLIQPPNQQV